MSDLFTLDEVTLATVQNGIDSLIHQLGKYCQLVYDGENSQCNNCYYDDIAKKSTNIYNRVGPKPFTEGRCPVCHGTGILPGSGVTTENIQFLVDWKPKLWEWVDPTNTSLHLPSGLVSIKGFAADMPKVIQSKYIIVDYTNAIYESNRFTRYNEPVLQGNIVKSKYFTCLLQRYQN